jgi:hypothetical protein
MPNISGHLGLKRLKIYGNTVRKITCRFHTKQSIHRVSGVSETLYYPRIIRAGPVQMKFGMLVDHDGSTQHYYAC